MMADGRWMMFVRTVVRRMMDDGRWMMFVRTVVRWMMDDGRWMMLLPVARLIQLFTSVC